jgi:Fe2+ or Zn2+ uptake regulation protein
MNYKSRKRDLILEKLRAVKSHPTAEELYFMVRSDLPDIGLATVYRNLDQLCAAGLALRLSGDVKRYDGTTHDHLHVRCPRCDRVFDMEAESFTGAFNELRTEAGSLGYGVRVEFVKVCDQCNTTTKEIQL